jgi:CBS domain-containing protein
MMLNEQNEKFDSNFDETEGFPPTPDNAVISKINFNSQIHGQDPDCERVLNEICDNYMDELIDVRPYMWEYPFTVTVHDTVEKCLSIFLTNHLRHLCVVNPVDGACVGIITRKDLFAYVDI